MTIIFFSNRMTVFRKLWIPELSFLLQHMIYLALFVIHNLFVIVWWCWLRAKTKTRFLYGAFDALHQYFSCWTSRSYMVPLDTKMLPTLLMCNWSLHMLQNYDTVFCHLTPAHRFVYSIMKQFVAKTGKILLPDWRLESIFHLVSSLLLSSKVMQSGTYQILTCTWSY